MVEGRIVTQRLVLEPVDPRTARAVVEGAPDGLNRGEGWPHADTVDALRMVGRGSEAWLILEAGVVIGDAGTHGPPDDAGDIEIGYGLAEPARGRGEHGRGHRSRLHDEDGRPAGDGVPPARMHERAVDPSAARFG